MIKISKELLSEVLGYEVVFIETNKDILYANWNLDEEQSEVSIGYRVSTGLKTINIYELAHKCKKWAFKQGYWLSIRLGCTFNVIIFSHIHSQLQTELFEVNGDTEVEAIIKACEWILKELKK